MLFEIYRTDYYQREVNCDLALGLLDEFEEAIPA